jgi:hypothetical protein
MYIELDLSAVPPTVTLQEPDDFKRFEIVATQPEHAFVGVAEIEKLAGERCADPEWHRQFRQMLEYARSKGWIDDEGSVRGHIEWR